jgi:type II secretory pathway pseudopilin PulG
MSAFIPVMGTIFVAIVTAAFGIFSYRAQKDTDRQVELRKQQRTAYENFLESYYDWTFTESGTDEDKKADDKYRQAYL